MKTQLHCLMKCLRASFALPACAAALLVLAAPARAADAARPRAGGRPNVILFLIDDQGFGDLGYHGNPRVQTPNLDRFARESVELSQFRVAPVCSPTRASLMTGRYNFRTGVSDVFGAASEMEPREVSVAKVFRAAGYATGIFGKWHLGDDDAHSPNAQGFEEALVHHGPTLSTGYFNPKLFHNGKEQSFTGYCMAVFTNAAIDFMRKNRSKPFFLYLPANLIHAPLQVPDELAEPYRAAKLDEKTAKIYGMLRSVDDNFGRLRAVLRDLGLEENTLLLLTSDNGTASESTDVTNRFMDGLQGLKGTVYENGIRVPCFARWPAGFASPAKVVRLTAHIDVMPTVLEACGIPPPAGVKLDGRSFLPLLRYPGAAWPERTLFFQWDSGQVPRRGHAFAVLSGRYKLVQPVGMDDPKQQHIRDRYAELSAAQGRGNRSIEGPVRYELYDIANDPGERIDLAADHPEIVAALRRRYEAWFDDVWASWHKNTGVNP